MSRNRFVAAFLIMLCVSIARIACAGEAETIRQTSQAFATAFDQGDAAAIAKLWTPDGELVDATGRIFKGRAEIEAAYNNFFAEHTGEKIKVSIDSIQLLSEDAALEQGTAALESAGGASGATYTAVHVKQDGKWLMAFVHEASAAAADTGGPLADLDWLVGKWTCEEYGATMTISCRWLPNKSFLERKFSVVTPDHRTTSGMQIVGLSPQSGKITSWNFNFDGSHAVANWVPTARGWAINSAGVLVDGTATHATNLLTKLDENAYSWQSVQRSISLEDLPDVGEVILRRVAPVKAENEKK